MIKTGLINISLRGMTLFSKFILILSIAHYLTPEDLGIWGLMNITLAISLLLVGMDFYVYNTREILSVTREKYVSYIKDQLIFHLLSYLIILPLLLVVFWFEIIQWQYIGWFYLLLVLEHLSQESIRLLIVLSRSNISNIVLFLRSGIWTYVVALLFYLDHTYRSLTVIWFAWAIGAGLSIILSILLFKSLPWKEAFKTPLDWPWIFKGLKISFPFLCATLAFVAIYSLDRYFLQYYHGEAMVGIYTFYFNISNVIHIAIYSGIIMVLYPQLTSAYQNGDMELYKKIKNKMRKGIILGVLIFTGIAVWIIKPVLSLLDKQIYADNLNIFYIMLISTGLFTLSYIPHYTLYVKKQDRGIIISTILALAVVIICNFLLVPAYDLTGAAVATLVGFVVLLFGKIIFVFYDKKTSNDSSL